MDRKRMLKQQTNEWANYFKRLCKYLIVVNEGYWGREFWAAKYLQ